MTRAAAPVRATAKKGRLPALDAVRVMTVLTVISVHSLSILIPGDGGAAGAVLMVFHSSREVFLLLSALVLTYTAGSAAVVPRRFWRRRFPLIAAPYIAWTVIYFLTDGDLRSVGFAASRLGFDLLTGEARYHLYFVLLTFQLYLVFPWLLRWVRRREGRLVRIVAASLAVQLAFTAVSHFAVAVPPPLSWLAAHPGSWLFSYQLYVVAGVAVGLHVDDVTAWCSRHVRALALVAAGTVAASLGWYFVELEVLGNASVLASDVFQPAVVLESLALGALELGACQRWTARASSRSLGLVARASDASFGIYLAHPLVLELAVNAGLASALASLPPAAAVAMIVLVTAPITFALVGLSVVVVRRTPLSLLLTGRARRRPAPQSEPAQAEMAQAEQAHESQAARAAPRPSIVRAPVGRDTAVRVP